MYSFFNEKTESDIDRFIQLCEQSINKKDYPFATDVIKNIVIYDGDELNKHIENNNTSNIKNELNYCLDKGSGVFIVKKIQKNHQIIKNVSNCYHSIIDNEKRIYKDKSDHFSSGANSRIWNSFEKLCHASTIDFIHYYSNPLLDVICQSWLGPSYQMTSQVNIVRPTGKAQVVHRDYHLGFQNQTKAVQFPINIHKASNSLTLQGAIAHTQAPVESGSTQLLPFSHLYDFGYIAVHQDKYKNYFNEHYVQLDLDIGDGLFFNPALFHAAGANTAHHIQREVNLLQISSPFAKAMEIVDRKNMIKTIYPYLSQLSLSVKEQDTIIRMVADGYPFPTNLDDNPPYENSMQSDQDIVKYALANKYSAEQFNHSIDE